MDLLADVIDAARIGPATVNRVALDPPWAILCDDWPRGGVHIVTRGSCFLHTASGDPLVLTTGDVAMVASPPPHTIGTPVDATPVPFRQVVGTGPTGLETAESSLICIGYAFSDARLHPLLEVLPPVVRVASSSTLPLGGELTAIVGLLDRELELNSPGGVTVINRLVDALFVYVIRAWLATQPDSATGWLGALGDPIIGQAVATLHRHPARSWTVRSLAAEVGTSRSRLARGFLELVGIPPGQYLTRQRISTASRLLRDTTMTVSEISRHVGYQTEQGFSKAFSREIGSSPLAYRRTARAAAADSGRTP
jgi:AraC-like DNA-binding protein